MVIVKILLGVAFVGSAAWLFSAPSFESSVTTAASLGAFIAAWLGDKKRKQKGKQNQVVEKNGIGIQAGGDVSVGNIETKGSSKDAK
jgi:thiol:disulfide interchange protein